MWILFLPILCSIPSSVPTWRRTGALRRSWPWGLMRRPFAAPSGWLTGLNTSGGRPHPVSKSPRVPLAAIVVCRLPTATVGPSVRPLPLLRPPEFPPRGPAWRPRRSHREAGTTPDEEREEELFPDRKQAQDAEHYLTGGPDDRQGQDDTPVRECSPGPAPEQSP